MRSQIHVILICVIACLAVGCPLGTDSPTGDRASVRFYRDSQLATEIELGDGSSRISTRSEEFLPDQLGFRFTQECHYDVTILMQSDSSNGPFSGLLRLSGPYEEPGVRSYMFCSSDVAYVCDEIIETDFDRIADSFGGTVDLSIAEGRIRGSFDITMGPYRAEGSVDLPIDFLSDEEDCGLVSVSEEELCELLEMLEEQYGFPIDFGGGGKGGPNCRPLR